MPFGLEIHLKRTHIGDEAAQSAIANAHEGEPTHKGDLT